MCYINQLYSKCITLHYIEFHWMQCIALRYIEFKFCIALHWIQYIGLHYIKCNTLHYITLNAINCSALKRTAILCIAIKCNKLLCKQLHRAVKPPANRSMVTLLGVHLYLYLLLYFYFTFISAFVFPFVFAFQDLTDIELWYFCVPIQCSDRFISDRVTVTPMKVHLCLSMYLYLLTVDSFIWDLLIL